MDPVLDDNLLLAEEQSDYFEITNYNVIPLIKINNVVYDQNISIRWDLLEILSDLDVIISFLIVELSVFWED